MNSGEYKVLLNLALDVDYLRQRLIPGYDLCFNRGSWGHIQRDLRDIAKLHGAKLRIVSKLSMEDALGLFCDDIAQISVQSSFEDKLELSPWEILTVFTHELGHAVQNRLLEDVPIEHQNKFFRIYSNALKYEQTAETLGFYIAKNYFSSLSKASKLRKRHFFTYFRKKDIISLAEMYDRRESDPQVQQELIKNGFKPTVKV